MIRGWRLRGVVAMALDVTEAGAKPGQQQPAGPAAGVECRLTVFDEPPEVVDLGSLRVERRPPLSYEAVMPRLLTHDRSLPPRCPFVAAVVLRGLEVALAFPSLERLTAHGGGRS